MGEVIYSPTSQFPVNGAYNGAENKVFGVMWSSRFGGGMCGPIQVDSQAVYPGGIQYFPDKLGTSGVFFMPLGGVSYPTMFCSTRAFNTTINLPMYAPVPPGATAITAINVQTQVAASALLTSNNSLGLFYDPLNGGATSLGTRAGISANDGVPIVLSVPGAFAAPTPGHVVKIEFRQVLGAGENPTPGGPFGCFWARLAITWG